MYKCIVPVSGGKDSQCCLSLAISRFGASNVLGLFCDTRFEHPLTYQHIQDMEEFYGVRIQKLGGSESVLDRCIARRMFPVGGARFCTNELKIRETRLFLKDYSEKHGAVEVWYGMRTDESSERAKRYAYKDPDELYQPHEVLSAYPQYLGKAGVRFRLPISDWNSKEVMEELMGFHNPLYDLGFPRVGCFPCLSSGDSWKVKAFEFDEFGRQQLIKVRAVEEILGKSVFTTKIGERFNETSDNLGCRLCEI